MTRPSTNSFRGYEMLISSRCRDENLTKAFRRPSALRDVESAVFFREYAALDAVAPNQHLSRHAILIGECANKTAINCLRGVGLFVSIGLGIGLSFL